MKTVDYDIPEKSRLEKILDKFQDTGEKFGFKFGSISKKTIKIILSILAIIFVGGLFIILSATKGFGDGIKFKNPLSKGSR
jgi:hypothetical protein